MHGVGLSPSLASPSLIPDQRQQMSVLAKSFSAVLLALPFSLSAFSDPLPPDLTYRPLPTLPFSRVKAADEAQKAAVMQRQSGLLNERYDLSDRAMQNVMMSGGRKPVQQGVRVKLAAGVTWDALAAMPPTKSGRRVCCLPASCRCRMSSTPPAARSSRIGRSMKFAGRRGATCGASTSTSTFLTTSRRSFRRRFFSRPVPNSATCRAVNCSPSAITTKS